jgi:hypothetical protein
VADFSLINTAVDRDDSMQMAGEHFQADWGGSL